MAPMIDMVFLLLVFFMCVSTLDIFPKYSTCCDQFHLWVMYSMLRYNEAMNLSAERFQRMVGVSFQKFHYLLAKLTEEVEHRREKNPMSKRGLSSAISLNDKLLLTLYYIRHYTTFEIVSCVFKVSESYANKIYHRISSILVSIVHVKGIKVLSQSDIDNIIIDASEQTIERPLKRQKDYYSGKKTAHYKSADYCG